MIKWITDYLGTSFYDYMKTEMQKTEQVTILDVRDMVDKSGNRSQFIYDKIQSAVKSIKEGQKIIVCCDYGMSRSNSIAAGILTKIEEITFTEAVRQVLQATGETAIKIEVLSSVRKAIDDQPSKQNLVNKRKSLLITGGSGYLGINLINTLKDDYDIIAPDRTAIDLMDGIINLDMIVKERRIDCIVHLANPRITTLNRSLGQAVTMLKNVLNVCVENNTKLIYLSNWEVYSGYHSEKLLASESLSLMPLGSYGEAKFLSEVLIENYIKQYDLKCAILRFSPIYGTGSDKPKFIYNFLNKVILNQEVTTHRYLNGSPILDLLHIQDATDAMKLAIKNELIGCYNIGSGIGRSTKEVAELIKAKSGSSSNLSYVEINGYTANVIMDSNRFVKSTGWRLNHSFEDWLTSEIHQNFERGK